MVTLSTTAINQLHQAELRLMRINLLALMHNIMSFLTVAMPEQKLKTS
jgi:hypothetical protein